MQSVQVVENPRRKRRRRKLSAAQRRAGFGGKRSMGGRRSQRRRRRNPTLATLAANPRRRRSYRAAPRRRYRRRRNPNMLGGMTQMINLTTAGGVATGMVVSGLAPGLVNRFWAGMPRGDMLDKVWRVGLTVGGAMIVKKVFRANQFAAGMVAGAVGYELFVLANQYLLPAIGLAGLGAGDYVTTSELDQIGLDGYVASSDRLTGYEMTDEALAA